MEWYIELGIIIAILFVILYIINPTEINSDATSIKVFQAIIIGVATYAGYKSVKKKK